MKFAKVAALAAATLVAGGAVIWMLQSDPLAKAPDLGKTGGPIEGISESQLARFREAHKLFAKDFHPEEGLGPLFNRRSCASCHGRPLQDGADGKELARSSVVRIAKIRPDSRFNKVQYLPDVKGEITAQDIDTLNNEGGPVLAIRSIVNESKKLFAPGTDLQPPAVPKDMQLISHRHAPPLFGMGLVDAISDETLQQLADEQKKNHGGKTFGKPGLVDNPQPGGHKIGRFGFKAQHPSILSFAAEAMHVELGLTNPLHPRAKSPTGFGNFPPAILKPLPPDPNDDGTMLSKFAWFVSLLAPPERGEINSDVESGESTFKKLGCAECHVPALQTPETVQIPAFYGGGMKVEFAAGEPIVTEEQKVLALSGVNTVRVKALESKPVRAYSDFLLHDMGAKLADGIGQETASGGEWRTAPLWGLRGRKYLLHDGRTSDVTDAIRQHGGQAADSLARFEQLNDAERQKLLAFLRSL